MGERKNDEEKENPMKRILFYLIFIYMIPAAFTKANVSDNNAKFIQAAKDGSLATVQTLLADGASPNTTDDNGVPVLMWAANNGHSEVVKLLLEKGAEVNAKATIKNVEWTALKVARRMGHTDIVQLLEKAGAKE